MKIDDLHDLPEWDDKRFNRGEDDEGEAWKLRPKRERAKVLYNQWRHVFTLVDGLLSILEPTEEVPENYLDHVKQTVSGDAMLVAVKIQVAEAVNLYVPKMENASIIRTAANSVYISMSGFRMMGVADDTHLDAVRREIDVFRELYKEWVNGFEKDEYDDEWGLFK